MPSEREIEAATQGVFEIIKAEIYHGEIVFNMGNIKDAAIAALEAAEQERQEGWRDIKSAPRNVVIDTYGYFVNKRNSSKVYIRNTDDFISKTSPYPLTTTYFEYQGGTGSYTRTHWMPLPNPPIEDKDTEQ